VERGGRSGRVDDGGLRALEYAGQGLRDAPLGAHRPVGGDDRDGARGAAYVEAVDDLRRRVAREEEGDRTAALDEPLGEREERRRRVALADQDAGDGLLGLGERATERADEVDRRADRQAGEPAAGDASGWTTMSMVAPCELEARTRCTQ
jgi:hypothetical protein